tara:strand:- start:4747 stop:5907 length:1161 start_codon:yes stop_codon:yes gene_type:complete
MFDSLIKFVRELYRSNDFIPLHRPYFKGNEKKYLEAAIDSTFVSSVGDSVKEFESKISEFTGINYAVATVNGTAALHLALKVAGVERNTEVITQSLTFVATCNAIDYCGATPVFVDVNRSSAGLDPLSLKDFLDSNCIVKDDGFCWNLDSNKKILACLPMHTFGLPAQLDELKSICKEYKITLIEDAAESLGSLYKKKHTGSVGLLSTLSFNGNKIITTGSGGMILTNNKDLAKRVKHLSTTAKQPHAWDFYHDEIGFNYRLANLNAALGIAQLELLPSYIKNKRWIAEQYFDWGKKMDVSFLKESKDAKSNYWLNTLIVNDKETRDALLKETNKNNIMTRPVWTPMHQLDIYKKCKRGDMTNTEWLFDRLVSLPSSIVDYPYRLN